MAFGLWWRLEPEGGGGSIPPSSPGQWLLLSGECASQISSSHDEMPHGWAIGWPVGVSLLLALRLCLCLFCVLCPAAVQHHFDMHAWDRLCDMLLRPH